MDAEEHTRRGKAGTSHNKQAQARLQQVVRAPAVYIGEAVSQLYQELFNQQSIAFAILYNNVFFLFTVCTLGCVPQSTHGEHSLRAARFFILRGFCAPFNYIMSVSGAATLAFYHSIQELQHK